MVLAWGILARSVPVLVDKQVIPARDLRTAAETIDGVRSVYAIRSRGSQLHCFAELTISVDKDVSVEVAHRTADEVETELCRRFGFNEITVHIEPC
jgi:divalent metal cation (Fe/Co/Zn/Cd) transporter